VNRVLTIAGREFQSLFLSPIGYIVLSVYIGLVSLIWWLITATNRYGMTADYRPIANNMHVFMLFVIPAITMRVLAEERRTRTLELLVTQPVRDFEIVLGKWLACVGVLAVMLAGTLHFYIQMSVWAKGDLESGPVWTAYLGLFLSGLLYLAIGVFFSSLTENQVVAAMLTFVTIVAVYFVRAIAEAKTGATQQILQNASALYHFDDFAKGVVDSGHIVYFVLATAGFLFMAVRSLAGRTWG
jgi:ABC-2 type transport system permease protein